MAARTRGATGTGAASLVIGSLITALITGSAVPAGASGAPPEIVPAASPVTPSDATPEDVVSRAQDEARRSGRRVEVTAERGPAREVYANPSGTLTEITHTQPVRTRKGGSWVDIDTTLRVRPDGGLAPVATATDVVFSGGGTGPLVRMTRAGRELALDWPGSLPAPILSGPAATYPDVLPDVDLRVSADADGFSQVLVVKNAKAAADPRLATLHMPVSGTGLTVRTTADGGLEAVDAQGGGVAFEAPRPKMWDSGQATSQPSQAPKASKASKASEARSQAAVGAAGSEAPVPPAASDPELLDGPAETSRIAPVGAAVTSGAVALTPDRDLLTDADTRYPVFIDPTWKSPRATGWAMVSRAYPGSSFYQFDGKDDAGLGFCPPNFTGMTCAPNDAKRLLYQVSVTSFAGKGIDSAEFVVRETHAYNCTKQPVEFWRTKPLTKTTTWNTTNGSGFWADQMPTVMAAKGATSSCPDGDIEFNAKDAVVWAAANKQSSLTFGLKAPNENAEQMWKRFSSAAYLRVEYNNPPARPKQTQLTTSPGGACTSASKPVNVVPKVTAVLTDPDKDQVYAEFRIDWDAGSGWKQQWSSGRIGPKASGQPFTITLPSTIPQNRIMAWGVRASDNRLWGPWSFAGDDQTGCYLTYDSKAPQAPVITSQQYPASDSADPADPWLDGVGRYGKFTMDSAATDVVKYQFGLNAEPSAANERKPSTPGGPVTVDLMPTRPGVNHLYVKAWDANNNASTIGTHTFKVSAGQPERATWSLDQPAGATTDPGKGGNLPATPVGGAVLGAPGTAGTALGLGGTDAAAEADPNLIDSDGDFTVSTWARLDALTGTQTVLSVDGTTHAGFYLGYELATQRWALRAPTKDGAGASFSTQKVVSAGAPETGAWTHLTAVRDSAAKQYRLYVNGVLQGTTPVTAPWYAAGRLQIGRAKYNGAYVDHVVGAVDETAVFDRALGTADVAALAQGGSVTTGRPAKAAWHFDDPAGSSLIAGANPVHPLALKGAATFGASGPVAGALDLSAPAASYASTTAPQLNTLQSFSVSAWARLPKTETDTAQIIATQAATQKSGFELYYSGYYRRWIFNRYDTDTADSDPTRAMANIGKPAAEQVYPGDEWHHLVGVYDATAKQLRLFVNGKLVSQVPYTATPINAVGPVLVGAGSYGAKPGSYFKGRIDDVRLYDRVLAPEEAGDLFKQHPQVKGRWTFNSATGTPSAAADDGPGKRPAVLGAQAAVTPGAGWVGGGALVLDGVGDYAATASMPVDTRDSFTATAWVNTASRPQRKVTVLSAEGAHNSAFTVRYAPDPANPAENGSYQLEVPTADAAGATRPAVGHSAFQSDFEWDHLAVVHDAFADEIRLYVNGRLEQVEGATSWRDNVRPFQATKSLQFGRNKENGALGEYWPGVIDDVWVFSGVASDAQIAKLGNGEELATVPGP
ncbi:LamG-like jellyroll fold domain-containing protein [Streptomyces sp. NPDC000961]|uniref:LamG-like jellyroll fold domain-containing protein n=1 Tax=Streptomyces sp. NPDC000961 TaxID=3364541 RepID=UPI0036CB423E